MDSGSPTGLEELDLAGVPYFLETEGVELLERKPVVVKSPGVRQDATVIAEALRRGLTVTGELELGWRMVDAPFLAVTGTNGKTTTTELAAHLFRTAGRPVVSAGNIGNPVSALAEETLDPGTTVVCEVSSFQLEDTNDFAPECSVFLNLAPDHLDRYRDLDDYGEAKLAIFANQVEGDLAVINADDPWLSEAELPGSASRVSFTTTDPVGDTVDLWLSEGAIEVDGKALVDVSELRILGRHNVENAMAAAAAAIGFGLPAEAVAEGLRTFAGVAHRLEPVAEIGGVVWINDSKATNVTATLTALSVFDEGVHLILGGSPKDEDYSLLAEPIEACCSAVYLTGQAGPLIGAAIRARVPDSIPVVTVEDLESAVSAASAATRPGETVLLSPACASFDQFRDFEERGERFRALVGSRSEDA